MLLPLMISDSQEGKIYNRDQYQYQAHDHGNKTILVFSNTHALIIA